MRLILLNSLIFVFACVVLGCANHVDQVDQLSQLTPQERLLIERSHYRDYHDYGFVVGCRAAQTQSEEKPERGWYNAPRLEGRYTDYLRQWQHGFQRCQQGSQTVILSKKD